MLFQSISSRSILLGLFFIILSFHLVAQPQQKEAQPYRQNKAPLQPKPYLDLPLGSIQPKGWLQEQLIRMKDGLTGHLDEIYPEVMGKRNGWLGGDGDGWERGPYWIDGLLPLAYILNDDGLKDKVKPWVEWTLTHQQDDGYIGPLPFDTPPKPEPGLQKDMRRDWWPKMVMLKILQQYYDATGDERVIAVLTNYFQYQLRTLPETPLDHWTMWANRRGGDNLMMVYWLYNITGDDFLLELAELINKQTFPWVTIFTNPENNHYPNNPWQYGQLKHYPFDTAEINSLTVSQIGGMHTVNFAQGLKQPLVYSQQHPDPKLMMATQKALSDVKKYHGQPQGMYGGDEPLHGNHPNQGVEFCSISEEMFSLETMLTISGNMEFADQLEKIAYNALPAQASDDFSSRQYFQAANQVELTDQIKTSFETNNHGGTDFVFGVLTGFPCCTSNMHQSWPKFVQNLWYATANQGVAAIQYAPSTVNLQVAGGEEVTIDEQTNFPFGEEVTFTFEVNKRVRFPFHVRIPAWTDNATVIINGEQWEGSANDGIMKIDRVWKAGDRVTLRLPMKFEETQWYQFARTIERGPLVYSLKIEDSTAIKDRHDGYQAFTEVYAKDPWNFGLLYDEIYDLEGSVQVVESDWDGTYPWNLSNAPIELKINGVRLPQWKKVNSTAEFPAWWNLKVGDESQIQKITLVPYGCTMLRITEFPVVHR